MFTNRLRTTTRAVTVALALGVLASSTLLASGSSAATQNPMYRKVSPPNVMFPIIGASSVKDLKNYSSRQRGTEIRTPCSRGVYAVHPGTAQVQTNPNAYSKRIVRVVSSGGGLVTTSGRLVSASVKDGQIIQSGQMIGKAGRKTAGGPCGIYFAVKSGGKVLNPSTWLNTWVGKTPPITKLFGNTGFNVASFNILGASHTVRSSRFATYKPRLDRAVTLMNRYKLDVVGTQEFQEKQYDYFVARGYSKTWGAHYWNPTGPRRDTENAVIWRKSTMEFVKRHDLRHPLLQRQHPARAGRAAAREGDRAYGVLHQRAQPGQHRREPCRLARKGHPDRAQQGHRAAQERSPGVPDR